MTIEDNDETIYTQKITSVLERDKNSKCLTVINTKGKSFDVDLKSGLRSCINNVTFMMLKLQNYPT